MLVTSPVFSIPRIQAHVTCGDPDLGSPNEMCSPAGPGTGEGGEPGEPVRNCEPLGNVLIIQEVNDCPDDIPDDAGDGGVLTLDFAESRAVYVKELGLLDIDYATSITRCLRPWR